MAFDAGSIQASLDLDINPFRRALDEARAEARAFAAGDTQATLGANADTAGANAELDRLKAKADEVSATRVNIQATADTARAQAELEALKLRADEASGAGGGAGGISGLVAAAVGLGPAMLPVLGATTAGLGAMLVPLTAATVGFGALGVFAIPAISQISKAMGPLNKDLQLFETSQPGPAQSLAWVKLQQDIAKLPPELRPVAQGIIDVELQIRSLGRTSGVNQALFGAFGTFLNDIKKLLPQIAPLAKEAALALGDLGTSVGKGLGSPAWQHFVDVIGPQIRPAIDAIGRSFGELIKGIGGVVEAFVPFAGGFEAGMLRITTAFANWGQNLGNSQGFRNFMQWVKDNEGAVGTAIKNIADALVNIVKASAGLGGFEIRALGDIAKVLGEIASIPGLGPVVIDTGLLALAVGKLVSAAQGLGVVKLGMAAIGSEGAGLSGAVGALSGSFLAFLAPLALVGAALIDTKAKQDDAEGAAKRWTNTAQSNIGTYAGLSKEVQSATDMVNRNNTAWWDNGSVLTNWADKQKHTLDAMTPVQQELIHAKGHVDDLSRAWGVSGDVITRAAQAAGVTIHQLGNAGHDAQIAVGVAMDAIQQQLGRLPPAVANDANQAMAGLTQALQKGQAPGAASQSEAAIEDAYKKLNVIPGMGQNVMNLLKTTIDAGGAQITAATHKNVDDLVANYQRMPPPVQDATRQAMEELNAGLASGNQAAINDAQNKLALLEADYKGTVGPISGAGADAGSGFASAMANLLQGGEAHVTQILGAYEHDVAAGLNPILESVGAATIPVVVGGAGGANVPGAHATGGIVTRPTYMVGEEGPKHREVVLTENPAYHAKNVGLWAQAGSMLGIPGFQSGGIPGQLEPPNIAAFTPYGIGSAYPLTLAGGTTPGVGFTGYSAATDVYNKAKAKEAAAAAAAAAVSSSGGGPFAGGPVRDYMLAEVAKRWPGPAEAAAFDYLEMREAGYDPNAANPTSNARGLAQNIAGWGPDYQPGNVQQQTAWMLNYISGRFGDPIAAAAHERAFNWYGTGAIFNSPSIIGVGEKGPEAVVPLGHGGAFGGHVTLNAPFIVQGNVSKEAVPGIQRALDQHYGKMMAELRGHGVYTPPGGTLS